MVDNTSKNKRIAKNTVFLYLRMLLLFVVNFYMTRILLQELGVDDFGLYNVVAGFVAMLGFINTSMTNSIQRFINYQMGKDSIDGVKRYFESSMLAQIIFAGVVFLLFETVGLWFVNNIMVIPEGREFAANVVYQSACICTMIGFVRAPYNALIIAKEKMEFYAYISILEAILKVAIIFALSWFAYDKLSLYGLLLVVVTFMIYLCSVIYCKKIVPAIRFRLNRDKVVLKEILSFSGWNLIGTVSGTIKSQGINILMNLFFGVAVNAARGVAYQVLGGIQQFVSNFQIAINPQIVQTYSAGEKHRYFQLTYLSAKISLYMMWILTLPVLFGIDDILALWLGEGNVPDYTNLFVSIILFTGLFDALGSSISVSLYATGNIKVYQIVVSTIKILVLPISYVLYIWGYAPASSMYVSLVLSGLEQVMRVLIWSRQVGENPMVYLKRIVLPALVVIGVSMGLMYLLSRTVTTSQPLIRVLIIVLYSIPISTCLIWFVGSSKVERNQLVSLVKSKIHK